MPDCDNQTCLQVLPHVHWVGGWNRPGGEPLVYSSDDGWVLAIIVEQT